MPTSVMKMEIPYARVTVSDCVTRYSYAPRLHFSGKKEYPFLNTVSLSVKEDIIFPVWTKRWIGIFTSVCCRYLKTSLSLVLRWNRIRDIPRIDMLLIII